MLERFSFIEVSAGVRYWEDAQLNGVPDTEGQISLRVGENWCPVIDVVTGTILHWPEGVKADVHYKVCDDGEYWILDAEQRRVRKWNGSYVPDLLCVGARGHGDYLIFSIGVDGRIVGWQQPYIDEEDWGALEA